MNTPIETQQVIVTATSDRPLRPLIEDALRHELAFLETGIHRTQQRLEAFETAHGMPTAEFLRRLQADEIAETLDTVEWGGEQRMWERLSAKANMLRGVRVVDP